MSPLNTAVHTQWMAKQEYTCSVLLWQLPPKGPTAAADVSLWSCLENHVKSKPHYVQHSSYLLSRAQLNYSIKKCQNSHLSFLVWVYLSLLFPRRHLMQILKNLSTPQEYRGIKHGAFNISIDFCKTHQSHKDSEFWGTLKTMPGTIWKGPARNVSSGGFSDKKYKGHWVKVSWEACKQENLPIKGTPSEHNVLFDCFIRISIYNCFSLLWTEKDRGAKALNQEEEGRQSRVGLIH